MPVSHDHQKQIQEHRFMAQPMKISAKRDLGVDDGVTPCPSHETIVEESKEEFNQILYLTAPFTLQQRRNHIHTVLPVGSPLVSRF